MGTLVKECELHVSMPVLSFWNVTPCGYARMILINWMTDTSEVNIYFEEHMWRQWQKERRWFVGIHGERENKRNLAKHLTVDRILNVWKLIDLLSWFTEWDMRCRSG